MYIDIIDYRLADKISENHLIKVAKEVIDQWMSKQKGFIDWEIHKNNDGYYTDLVYWKSKQDSINAEKQMSNIPETIEWATCYKKGSISSRNLTKIVSLK